MDLNPDKATEWNGRILVHYCAEETKKPELAVQDIQHPWEI